MRKKRDRQKSASEAASAKARRAYLKSAIPLCIALTVAVLAVVAFLSRAWFANNRDVSAKNSSITAETPTPSLFIALGKLATRDYENSVAGSAGNGSKGLYPISTVDCKKWYYAKEWVSEVIPSDEGGDGIATRPVVSGYGEVENQNETDMAVTYTDDFNKLHTAYYKQSFNIYTDRGSLDVYLNPENPITVSYADSVTTAEGRIEAEKIMKALRIAVVDSTGNVLVYYVPEAEEGKGNSMNAVADKYQGIKGTTADDIESIGTYYDSETINGITAAKSTENVDAYTTKTGSLRLGTADANTGIVLDMYVWLEGTDAQALQTITAGIDFLVEVTLSLVGVESAAQ